MEWNDFSNSRQYHIEIYKTMSGYYYFKVRGSNNKIIATGNQVTSKENCLKTASLFAKDLKCKIECVDFEQ